MQCIICKKTKPISDFYFRHDRNKYRPECKECFSRISQINYQKRYGNNSDLEKAKNRSKSKRWKMLNKDKITKYERRLRKTNVTYKLRKNVSRSIHYYLIENGGYKTGKSIFNFLPYSILDLKLHIENQFEPWMSWENYGSYSTNSWNDNDVTTWTWQIDHIIPQSTFGYITMKDSAFNECWDINNLRPLNSKQNLMDGVSKKRHKKLITASTKQ